MTAKNLSAQAKTTLKVFLSKRASTHIEAISILSSYVENKSDKDYTIKLKVSYTDNNGNTIDTVRNTYEGFAAGWHNYYVYSSSSDFAGYTYSLTFSEYNGTAYTGDVSDGSTPIKLSVESTGKTWQEIRTGNGKLLA